MSDLFVDNNLVEKNTLYPIVITMQEDGMMLFEIPGVEHISCCDTNIQSGLNNMKESLNEELLTSVIPICQIPTKQIILAQNQILTQISAN